MRWDDDAPDEAPDVPWDHCVECGEPIWKPPRSKFPRCYFCTKAKVT